jgi:hypothetical protein
MRINSQNVAPRTYKVQNVAAPDLSVAKNLPNLTAINNTAIIVQPQPKPASNPLGEAIGAALSALSPFNLIKAVFDAIGSLFKKDPELAKPSDTPLPKPVVQRPALDAPNRRRLENAFREMDEDGNGRLEGDELTSNSLLTFDPVKDEGITQSEFVDEVAGMEGSETLTAAALRETSLKGAIFKMMTEVWGTDGYCNHTSFMWWKGQLKTVNGDMDRLRVLMENYKKSIEH